VVYRPFGEVYEDFDSAGFVIGNPSQDGIVWSVPFRFPGQYADPELGGKMWYNWNRYYIPELGRYNRADPIRDILVEKGIFNNVNVNGLLQYSLNSKNSNFSLIMRSNMSANILIGKFNSSVYTYNYSLGSPLVYTDFAGLLTRCREYCTAAAEVGGAGAALASAPAVPVAQAAGGIVFATGAAVSVFGPAVCKAECESMCNNDLCNWYCYEKTWYKPWEPFEMNDDCEEDPDCIRAKEN